MGAITEGTFAALTQRQIELDQAFENGDIGLEAYAFGVQELGATFLSLQSTAKTALGQTISFTQTAATATEQFAQSVSTNMDQTTRNLGDDITLWSALLDQFKTSGVESMQAFAASIVQVFATIRTNFTNMIVGMIAGTTTFKQFLTNLWQSILSILINSFLNLLANYIIMSTGMTTADQLRDAARIETAAATEAALTATTTAGEAARAAIVMGGNKVMLGAAASTIAAIVSVGTIAVEVMSVVTASVVAFFTAMAAAAAASVVGAPLAPAFASAAAILGAVGAASAAGATAAIGAAAATAYGTIGGLVATPFAAGGLVTRPTLGLVGEAGPEIIAPFSEFKSMFDGSGQSVTNIIELDGRVIAKNTMRHMPKVIRQQGVPL